jgi:uncharacterized protein with LGFP repeats
MATVQAVSRRRRLTAIAVSFLVAVASTLLAPPVAASSEPVYRASVGTPTAASSLSGSQFNAGYIIHDALFYSPSAMTQPQIQAFLDSMVGTCTNANCLNVLYAKTESRNYDRGICKGYTPDSDALERASMIIYKVQVSCGISAKVILVTLQKEQGLVTHKGPTSGRLGAAMGWLCPDTAPCNTSAASFFRQIYGGAWQLKRYNTPDYFGNYHPGTHQILYHPNRDCGTKTVAIRNHATAALYNYTPYTPNAGALANLGGTAPPCGSYGNRNFWVFYNQWFGSPLAGAGEGEIAAAYEAHGGETGALGRITSSGTCGVTANSCSKTYEHGVIFWKAASGTFVVSGAIGDYYLSRGGTSGVLGVPTRNAVAIASETNGDGYNQPFSGGLVSSSDNGIFAMIGAYRTKQAGLGGVAGSLGWPTAERTCALAGGACMQPFQHGWLFSAKSTSEAFVVADPEIVDLYRAMGGPDGALGAATRDPVPMVGGLNGSGFNQPFVGGLVSKSTAGAFAIIGPLRSAHGARGGVAGPLGWPLAERVCGLPDGTCSQQFQHGTLYASASLSGSVAVDGIEAYYAANGGDTGPLGLPRRDAVPMAGGANGAGFNQPFGNALVSSGPEGTFSLVGAIRSKHGLLGGVAGRMGWPLADQACDLPDGGCSQPFQHGTIYAYGSVAFATSHSEIAAYYATAGGPTGSLGYPTRDPVPVGGRNQAGFNQPFQNGLVSSGPPGTFSMVGGFRVTHGKLGGVAGALGWPLSDRECGLPNDGCLQRFQHGVITIDSAGTRVSFN